MLYKLYWYLMFECPYLPITKSWGYAAMAAATVASQAMQNDANADATASANAANSAMSERQMAWQKMMSDTAHRREAEDLELGGYNRILAFNKGGGGASTPTGSAPDIKAPHIENALGNSLSTALQARSLEKEIASADSQMALNDAAVQTQRSQEALNFANSSKTTAEKFRTDQESHRLSRENELGDTALKQQKQALQLDASTQLNQAKINNKMSTYDAIMSRTKQATGVLNDAVGVFKPKIQVGGDAADTSNLRRENKVMKDYITRKAGQKY